MVRVQVTCMVLSTQHVHARSSTRRMHGGCLPAHRRPGLSIESCKGGGLVIHVLDPKHPSACPLRGLSVADLADLPPKQRQAALSISLGRCVSPPVFLPACIVEPLGCSLSLSLSYSSHHITHTFTMVKQKVCLAYSGGLDTSCILRYLLVSLPTHHNVFVCGPLTDIA